MNVQVKYIRSSNWFSEGDIKITLDGVVTSQRILCILYESSCIYGLVEQWSILSTCYLED